MLKKYFQYFRIMFFSIFNFVKKIKSTFFLDKYEKFYIKNVNENFSNNKNIKSNIFYSATPSYYSLCFSNLLLKEKKYKYYKFIFCLPELAFHKKNPQKNILIFVFSFYYKNLILFLKNNKWKKLYKSKDVHFVSLNNFNIFKEIKNLRKAIYIKSRIKDVNDLVNFSYKGINIGNLIYDTYLRFNDKVTLEFKDFFITEIIAKAIHSHQQLVLLRRYNNISEYYSNQLAYIQHGLIARFFSKYKIPVKFTGAKGFYIADYNEKNYFQAFNFRKYKFFFGKLKNPKARLIQAKKLLQVKFSGKIIPQENWMTLPAYDSNYNNSKIKNFKVIIFLHCFVDSPSARGKFLFLDFADWINQLLKYFIDKNLVKEVAIKPHPHGKDGTKVYVKELKKLYPEFLWLDEKIPNNYIFRKKPIIGLSVLGTVLPELAYHNIVPIAAGTHPSMSFNFVFTPKTIKDYFILIDKGLKNKLKLPKDSKLQIYKYYYCDFIYDHPRNSNLLSKKIFLKDWNFVNSNILSKFIFKIRSDLSLSQNA
jgi:hypothetical protein